jgi:hypothetical protein
MLALACLALLARAGEDPAAELAPPFRVEAAGAPIDVDGGNAAPAWHDLDGDGLPELLVGQFEQGCVRVYPNVGRAGAPRFATWHFLRAGEELLEVPYG